MESVLDHKTLNVSSDDDKSSVIPPNATNACFAASNKSKCNLKRTPIGISGFQNFIWLKSENISSESAVIFTTNDKTENFLTASSTTEDQKEQDGKTLALPVVYPNILRHSQKKLLTHNISSPIKTLTFSPSKFLNGSHNETIDKGDMELNLDFSTTIGEDSGIVISDCDSSLLPLTSTPSSRRKSPHHNVDVHLDHDDVFSSTQEKDHGETPQIEKFLNESMPRTPTPFKCPNLQSDSKRTNPDPILTTAGSYGVLPLPHKISSDLLCISPDAIKEESKKISNVRKMRKSLALENNFRRTLFDETKKFKKHKSCSSIPRKNDEEFQQNEMLSGRFINLSQDARRSDANLNQEWVSVACGRSYDQVLMTAAAKSYLSEK